MSTPVIVLSFLGNWASDTFAMAIGKRFGKHKLCPKLSPNKTVEGAFGAIFGAFFVATNYYLIINNIILKKLVYFVTPNSNVSSIPNALLKVHLINEPPHEFTLIMFYAAVIGVAAIIGDLVESWMKRVLLFIFIYFSNNFFCFYNILFI